MMGGKSKEITTGYRYFMGLHMALCHSGGVELRRIDVGGRVAWEGSVSTNQTIYIDKYDLFGGESREGGVQGNLDVMLGEPSQDVNSYLQSKIGLIPAFRGIVSVVFKQGLVAMNNPYLKSWSFLVKRIPSTWYPEKAAVPNSSQAGEYNMNPAHIIYECLTNNEWGMGYPTSQLDDTSFRSAADTLYSEGFGIGMKWAQQETIENFIGVILDHINGTVYADPATGKFAVKLVRQDYDVGTLPTFDESNVLNLESFQRSAWGETVNEITVVYTDPVSNEDTSITVQDLANIQLQGGVLTETHNYLGVRDHALAQKLAMRDLVIKSTPIAKVVLKVNRSAWNIVPGQSIKLSWAKLGIVSLVMRVVKVDSGTATSGALTIEAVEDVFTMPTSVYGEQQPIGWTDPITLPATVPFQKIEEATYWDLARTIGDDDAQAVASSSGYILACGSRPSPDAYNYGLQTRTGTASFTDSGNGDFCPVAKLATAVGKTDTTFTLADAVDLDLVEVNTWAAIGTERVKIKSVNVADNTITVARGVIDTVPQTHDANTVIYFADGFYSSDFVEYAQNESVSARLLTRTGRGVLDPALAPVMSVKMNSRQERPYPPGNFKINNLSYPNVILGQAAFSWAHRDRLQQTAYIVEQSEGNIGPEAGVTYSLVIKGETGAVERTVSTTSNYYTYAFGDEITDGNYVVPLDTSVPLIGVQPDLPTAVMQGNSVPRNVIGTLFHHNYTEFSIYSDNGLNWQYKNFNKSISSVNQNLTHAIVDHVQFEGSNYVTYAGGLVYKTASSLPAAFFDVNAVFSTVPTGEATRHVAAGYGNTASTSNASGQGNYDKSLWRANGQLLLATRLVDSWKTVAMFKSTDGTSFVETSIGPWASWHDSTFTMISAGYIASGTKHYMLGVNKPVYGSRLKQAHFFTSTDGLVNISDSSTALHNAIIAAFPNNGSVTHNGVPLLDKIVPLIVGEVLYVLCGIENVSGAADKYVILKTSDGGASWSTLPAPVWNIPRVNDLSHNVSVDPITGDITLRMRQNLSELHFDGIRYWVAGWSGVATTTSIESGSWAFKSAKDAFGCESPFVRLTHNNAGVVSALVDEKNVYWTSDGGVTWNLVTESGTTNAPVEVNQERQFVSSAGLISSIASAMVYASDYETSASYYETSEDAHIEGHAVDEALNGAVEYGTTLTTTTGWVARDPYYYNVDAEGDSYKLVRPVARVRFTQPRYITHLAFCRTSASNPKDYPLLIYVVNKYANYPGGPIVASYGRGYKYVPPGVAHGEWTPWIELHDILRPSTLTDFTYPEEIEIHVLSKQGGTGNAGIGIGQIAFKEYYSFGPVTLTPYKRPNTQLSVELRSIRDGMTSWQAQSHVVDRAGYGYNYGKYYGGI